MIKFDFWGGNHLFFLEKKMRKYKKIMFILLPFQQQNKDCKRRCSSINTMLRQVCPYKKKNGTQILKGKDLLEKLFS